MWRWSRKPVVGCGQSIGFVAMGGVTGALGFKRVGYVATILLASS